jgi:hypothetical protein
MTNREVGETTDGVKRGEENGMGGILAIVRATKSSLQQP